MIKVILLVLLCIFIITLPLWPTKEDPFFKERCFKYYKDNELVAIERRSYAEPAMYFMRELGVPEYDTIVEEEL